METLFYAAMGWCGTKYPGWWRGPRKPEPEPWWKYAVLSVVGIVVGLASGVFFNNAIGNDSVFTGQEVIASGLFSFAVSNIATGLASMGMNEKTVR